MSESQPLLASTSMFQITQYHANRWLIGKYNHPHGDINVNANNICSCLAFSGGGS